LSSYDAHIEAHFLWTGHNEIEAKWDYIKAWENMWINTLEEVASVVSMSIIRQGVETHIADG
jgi:hypothetical protein